jgi:hypothetical protein
MIMLVETVEYKGKKIEIHQDEDPQNPRTEWDNMGTMTCFHNRYSLGDKHQYKAPWDFLHALATEHVSNPNEQWSTLLSIVEKYYIILPLYLLDHGGITMSVRSFNDAWDSGQVGWIWISKKDACKELGVKRLRREALRRCIRILESEVSIYDDYLRGDVYGWVAGDDSVWGYYGSDYEASGLMDDARSTIDSQIASEEEEANRIMALQRDQEGHEGNVTDDLEVAG